MGNTVDVNNFRSQLRDGSPRHSRPAGRATARSHPPAEFASWREQPGLRQAMYHGKPAWVVSRYQDIRAALVDPRLSADTIPDSIMPIGRRRQHRR